jgi:cytochrome c oxidase subunit 2
MRQRIKTVLVTVMVLVLSCSFAAAQDLSHGKQLYKLCSACHGEKGQGNQMYNAPALAGLGSWYVEAQLQKFQDGLRGYHADDAAALQMRPMACTLRGEEDLKAVAAYVATLSPVWPSATVTGDATRGKDLYATCAACHGQSGEGNEAVKSPGLAHQTDWYIVSQLKKFRDGLRGAQKDDIGGVQMRAMTMLLQDDQAFNDIAAYVLTLKK